MWIIVCVYVVDRGVKDVYGRLRFISSKNYYSKTHPSSNIELPGNVVAILTLKLFVFLLYVRIDIYPKLHEIKLKRIYYHIIKEALESLELYKRYLRKLFLGTFGTSYTKY